MYDAVLPSYNVGREDIEKEGQNRLFSDNKGLAVQHMYQYYY